MRVKILAIETSCDDTGVAILEANGNSFNVLSNIVSSQILIHKKYGGVYPRLAKREHQKNLIPVFKEALKKAEMLKLSNFTFKDLEIKTILGRETELEKQLIPFLKKYERPDIDLISVTNGPGLEPCLWVGVSFAKAISYAWNIPIVPINHIEAHILVNFLNVQNIYPVKYREAVISPRAKLFDQVKFPAISLIVSGGHTQIILMKGIKKYKILGETKDDAAGECFDKCANILGLGYPGGPIISKLAEGIKTQKKLPRPMFLTNDYDFSFSGLKTSVLYAWQKTNPSTRLRMKYKKEMAAEIQQAIIDVLIKKTIKAVRHFKAKSLILGGGVSANQELRKQFKNKLEKGSPKTEFFVPKPDLSTDNALMIAMAGFYHQKDTKNWQKIKVDSNLRIHPVK